MNRILRWLIIRKIKKTTEKIKKGEIMRPGIKTSEFWTTLIGGIVVAICNAYKVDPQIRDAIIKLVVAYISSRTAVKVAENIKSGKKK